MIEQNFTLMLTLPLLYFFFFLSFFFSSFSSSSPSSLLLWFVVGIIAHYQNHNKELFSPPPMFLLSSTTTSNIATTNNMKGWQGVGPPHPSFLFLVVLLCWQHQHGGCILLPPLSGSWQTTKVQKFETFGTYKQWHFSLPLAPIDAKRKSLTTKR
jgi:hypothetical protein